MCGIKIHVNWDSGSLWGKRVKTVVLV